MGVVPDMAGRGEIPAVVLGTVIAGRKAPPGPPSGPGDYRAIRVVAAGPRDSSTVRVENVPGGRHHDERQGRSAVICVG